MRLVVRQNFRLHLVLTAPGVPLERRTHRRARDLPSSFHVFERATPARSSCPSSVTAVVESRIGVTRGGAKGPSTSKGLSAEMWAETSNFLPLNEVMLSVRKLCKESKSSANQVCVTLARALSFKIQPHCFLFLSSPPLRFHKLASL